MRTPLFLGLVLIAGAVNSLSATPSRWPTRNVVLAVVLMLAACALMDTAEFVKRLRTPNTEGGN
jgi:arginine exporter protein ArgO